MFGGKAVWEAVKALLKVAVISIVVIMVGRRLLPELAAAGTLPISTTVARASDGLETMIWRRRLPACSWPVPTTSTRSTPSPSN